MLPQKHNWEEPEGVVILHAATFDLFLKKKLKFTCAENNFYLVIMMKNTYPKVTADKKKKTWKTEEMKNHF